MNPSQIVDVGNSPAEVVGLTFRDVKYIEVEIKTPEFKLFRSTIPIRSELTISSLADRFHNLHPDVEGTIKKCGFMFPPIEWRHLHPKMDIVIEHSKSEWVRIRVVDKPNES